MLDFETYVARLGEHGVQAIVERLERYEGVKAAAISLEDRWNALMANDNHADSEQRRAA